MIYKQYQTIVVNLDPTVGSEIQKTRPCVIISPDEMNVNLNTVVIAPITSNLRQYPSRVKLKMAMNESMIVLDQIRTIDKTRIIKRISKLSKIEVDEVKNVIYKTFVQ